MRIPCQDELLSKKDHLHNVKETLKQEFIGINFIINDIVDSISSWYFYPSFQTRPQVINLWGMTGVGKSSLINRMIELIGFEERFFKYDMGEISSSGSNIKWLLKGITNSVSGKPFILCFDEFQFARTLDPLGNQLNRPASRAVWEILGEGEIKLSNSNNYASQNLLELVPILKRTLREGVRVRNGRIVSGEDIYRDCMSRAQLKECEENFGEYFVPKNQYTTIFEAGKESFGSVLDVVDKLKKLDGEGTIMLLDEIVDSSYRQLKLDCTQAIIFIVGNLDEAFSMSGEINPDLSANRNYKNSLKVNISSIKQNLRSYFRSEQLARLGNNHLIYPALSEESYRKIIDLELDKVKEKFKKETDVSIYFHHSVTQLLYKEGVYPSMGTRPLLSTIHNYITSKLGLIISDLITLNESFHSLLVKNKKERLIFEFRNAQHKIVHSRKFSSSGSLSKLREPKRDNSQAISAVHESGHAILAISLMGVIPSLVCSVSAEASNNGFTYLSMESEIFCKKDMIARAAMALGGYLAEKLIFGEDYVHTGSSDDLQKITQIVSKLVKSEGMGSELLSVNIASPDTNFSYHDNEGRLNEEVRKVMRKAEELAEQTLKNEMNKLLILADYLSDNAKIDQEGIIELLGIDGVQTNWQPFRKQLKEKVNKIKSEKKNVA